LNPPSNEALPDGFTLVEMLITSLVFTVAIVSLMSMVPVCACRAPFIASLSALKLSQQKLEELKAYPLEHPALLILQQLDARGELTRAADPQATVAANFAERHAQYVLEFRDAMEHYQCRITQDHHCCDAQSRRQSSGRRTGKPQGCPCPITISA
jgi:Tfp pilus assembly protein PilV